MAATCRPRAMPGQGGLPSARRRCRGPATDRQRCRITADYGPGFSYPDLPARISHRDPGCWRRARV